MRKAWLASVVSAAGLAALGVSSAPAAAGVVGLSPSPAIATNHSNEITKVNHRYWYYGPAYYPRYYYAPPYAYVYPPAAYYPPPVTYYAVPAPRYVPYDPYGGYYVRRYRSRYYYGW
ncbi:hypothetical protein [Hyphomicrobium sp.]|jgi:hypothetical protein|uniref:hypothetical protein n=1 Tax=Hyphomicrobium sp. TaxID=82 RepID=UPI002B803BE9|nr:hypothetical protein [Hyphomicrobium sp.]HVZ04801.1 hypothetical protein [Hyphomicrobium sp.]